MQWTYKMAALIMKIAYRHNIWITFLLCIKQYLKNVSTWHKIHSSRIVLSIDAASCSIVPNKNIKQNIKQCGRFYTYYFVLMTENGCRSISASLPLKYIKHFRLSINHVVITTFENVITYIIIHCITSVGLLYEKYNKILSKLHVIVNPVYKYVIYKECKASWNHNFEVKYI